MPSKLSFLRGTCVAKQCFILGVTIVDVCVHRECLNIPEVETAVCWNDNKPH